MYETLDRSEGRVIGFELHDEVTEADLNGILGEIERTIATQDRPVRVLLRFDDFPGVEFGALDEELGFWLEHGDDIDRHAVVSGSRLIEGLVAVEDRLTEMEIRQFDPDELAVAWAWLA
ncbi:hypothetical protein JCM30237_07620 [Halolamina litorea]|uniref:STAS/SEC14 domain-containing protein n=1 Tax=Halolamina litorea TaxID=1515593 RepID=A0ABD6BS26_9EURY|nr:STAS/SEC14 domain-containing protein [Halolamina litorea]